MSLDLVELPRIKVPPFTHALLSARAEVNAEEINATVREVLVAWAAAEQRAVRIANRHLKARGLPGVDGEG